MSNTAEDYHKQGIALIQSGKLAEAEQSIRQAIASDKDQSIYYNNLGYCLHEMGRVNEALELYLKANELSPNNSGTLNNMGRAYLHLGNLAGALRVLSLAMQLNPASVEILNNLGIAYRELRDFDKAEHAFSAITQADPNHADAWNNLALTYQAQQKTDEAIKCYRHVEECGRDNPIYTANLARFYEGLNDLDKAMEVLQAALSQHPDSPDIKLTVAKIKRRQKDFEAAKAYLTDISDDDPRYAGDKYYELGFIQDALNEAKDAFESFARANDSVAKGWLAQQLDKDEIHRQIGLFQDVFKPEWVETWSKPVRSKYPAPVFLVGFPRSGTTLLEQILGTHPRTRVIEEEPLVDILQNTMEQAVNNVWPSIAQFSQKNLQDLQDVYFNEATKYVDIRGKAVIIDKMPLNMVSLGIIHRVFPRAKIIFALRHPCDCVLSCFMQNFDLNNSMANFLKLEDAANLYDKSMNLMEHYRSVLSLDIHQLRYEDLLDDLEGETRKLLKFLGLSWVPDMEKFYEHAQKKKGGIKTPSYHQVSQPIYKQAKYRWQRYEEHMAPVLDMLEPYIERFGYK